MLGIGTQGSFGQTTPLEKMERTIQTLVSSPWFPSEKESRQAYDNLLQSSSNDQLAVMIAELAYSRPIDINGLYALRMIGSHAKPEFESAIAVRLGGTQDPLALGRLILLLRNAKPPVDVSLLPLLDDKRAAEKLSENDMGKRAHGGIPFRVCDIAYNVIQEIKASNESVGRTSSPEARDAAIAHVKPPTASPGDLSSDGPKATQSPPPSITPTLTKHLQSKPAPTPREEPTSSTPWSIIVVLIVAAMGLLWLLLKGRK